MQKIVVASSNVGKIREIQAVCEAKGIEICGQADFNVPEVEETGLTFVENAIIKARHCAKYTNLPVLADDSGLEVFALQGEPGIHSARYSGLDATADKNIEKLLLQMEGIPLAERQAQFQCVLVLFKYPTDPAPMIAQGAWQGSILLKKEGNKGFGYDPIFYVPEFKCSAASLPADVKNKISHRAKALTHMLQML